MVIRMNIDVISLALLCLATVFNGAIIVLLLTGKKYNQLLDPLDPEEFTLKDTYGIGFRILELKREDYRSKWFARQEEYLEILYEKKYVPYYLRVYCARRLTLTVLIVAVMLSLSAMSGDKAPVMAAMTVLMSVAVYKNYSGKLGETIEKRSDQMTSELPEVVNRLALLINAGMILREAWESVANSGDTLLYQEMRIAHNHIENGLSESDGIFLFGRRSQNSEVRKFSSQLIQSIDKGGSQLASELTQLSKEMIELKRQYVFRKTDAAATKLLAPMFVMFLGVLILIAVPILINML